MNRKIKILAVIFSLVMMSMLISGCGKIRIPDVISMNEKEAVNKIKEAGLKPVVEYEFDSNGKRGTVLRSSPRASKKIAKDSKVYIYISKGPEKIIAEDARCSWVTMGKTTDRWEFTLPYVDKEILYIDCQKVTLSAPAKWVKGDEESTGYGVVSLDESFENVIPVKVRYEKEAWEKDDSQRLLIEVPVTELGEELPQNLYFRLDVESEEEQEEEGLRVNFQIFW